MKNFHTLLVERGVATMRQAEEAMAKQVLYGGDLATYVLEQVGPTQEQALNDSLGAHYKVDPAVAGPLPPSTAQAAQVVPRELALRHTFYPLRFDGKVLVVAVASPLPEEVEGDLFFVLGAPTQQIITSRIRIRQALARDFALPLDAREQRTLAKIEGRPATPSTIPPPDPSLGPPSIRAMTMRIPVNKAPEVPAEGDEKPAAGAEVSAASVPPAPLDGGEVPAGRQPAWPQATRGLLRWMQRASQSNAAPRPRRRRGPMPLSECEEWLSQASTAEEVLLTLFDFAQQYFAYSALFVVQGDLAEGRDAYGPGADRERVAGIGVPLDLPSCLAHARNRGAPVCIQLRHEGLDASLAADLKRSPQGAVFVLPVMVRQRCVALIFSDDGEASIELSHAAEVIAAASLAGNTLEQIAARRKRRSTPVSGSPVVPRRTTIAGMPAVTFSESPLPLTQHRQQKSQALARALGLRTELPRPAVPPPTLASPPTSPGDESNPFRRITAAFQAVKPAALDDEAVPSTVLAPPAARPTENSADPDAPEVQVSERDLDDDELVRAALQEMLAAGSSASSPPSEHSAYAPPSRPPSERHLVAQPSIIVDLDEQQTRLLDRLTATPYDNDEVMSEILREGVRMVPALLTRQPGPLRVPREALLQGRVRPSQAGPLLRALVSMRRTALPFVVAHSGNARAESRLFATLLLGEFPYPEAATGLLPRVFDSDTSVGQAALLSGRLLRSSPEVFNQLLGDLQRIAESRNEPPERRARATSALATLSVPG